MTAAFFAQDGFRRRFEWGLVGARRLQPWVDVLVVVDVLSFSTAVDVALARGAAIAPFAWMDERAVAYAQKIDAYLAVGRTEVSDDHPYSLSPVSIQQLPRGARLVLPSPNGAAICADMATAGVPVLTACLRNATAVAAAALTLGETVGVIAAGERWPDGTLRPALEDLAGAGAVLTALDGAASPEACAAIRAAEIDTDALRESSSARELTATGYEQDVIVALERDVSEVAPTLSGGLFRAA